MNHKSVERQLAKYLAGELPKEEREKMESHLQICCECEKKLEEIFEFENSLQNLLVPYRAPRTLAEEILFSLEEKDKTFDFPPLPKGHTTVVVVGPNQKSNIFRRGLQVCLILILLFLVTLYLAPFSRLAFPSLQKEKRKEEKVNTLSDSKPPQKVSFSNPKPKKKTSVIDKSRLWRQYETRFLKALDFCYGARHDEPN